MNILKLRIHFAGTYAKLQVVSAFGLIIISGCSTPGRDSESTGSYPPARSAQPAEDRQQGQRFPLVIYGSPDTKQAAATLVLSVSWMFSGSQGINGGAFVPDAELSKLNGPSGIAGDALGKPSLPFSGIYKDNDHPHRLYFKVGDGGLQLWWSDAQSAAANNQIHLSPRWLAAAKDLSPTADHPAGGISISSQSSDGQPLAFFIEFAGEGNLSGPKISDMGTQ